MTKHDTIWKQMIRNGKLYVNKMKLPYLEPACHRVPYPLGRDVHKFSQHSVQRNPSYPLIYPLGFLKKDKNNTLSLSTLHIHAAHNFIFFTFYFYFVFIHYESNAKMRRKTGQNDNRKQIQFMEYAIY